MNDTELKAFEQKVIGMIAEKLGASFDSIKLDQRLKEDLGMDSLDTAETMIALEECFHCEISNEEFEKCKTIQDVVCLMNQVVCI